MKRLLFAALGLFPALALGQTKISELTDVGSAWATGDLLALVDVSATPPASGTTKKGTAGSLWTWYQTQATAFSVVVDANAYTADAGSGIDVQSAGALDIGNTTATSIDYGSASVTAHTFTADGTTDADFVVPNTSIGGAEIVNDTLGPTQIDETAAYTWSGASLISGVHEVQDDIDLNFGNDANWSIQFDEAVDDQLLIETTGTAATAITDPLIEILVGTTPTADQQVFGIAKGTQASNTPLFTVDEDGDVVAAGDINVTNVTAAQLVFTDANQSPSTVGEFEYDNTITGLDDGAIVWYDDDEVRSLVDINGSDGAGTALASGDDGKYVKFTWAAGAGYFSLDSPAGSGDITAVGPAYASGDAFTDGTASTGTDMLIWEGTGVDTNELRIISPSANPAADIDITLPAATGTLLADTTTIYETIYIDAGAMMARTTNPAATGTIAGTNTSQDVWDFDTTTEEGVHFKLVFPDDWDESTIKAKFYWTSSAGATPTTDGVTWGLSAQSLADDAVLDTAFGASVDTDDNVVSAATDVHVSAASTAVTVTGAGGVSELTLFEVTRVVGDANDNMDEDARLLGVEIQFGRNLDAAAW